MFFALDELLGMLHRPAWHRDALCLEHPEVSFFPARGEIAAPAKAVCARCLVAQECMAFALADPAMEGVWGVTTIMERRRLRVGRVA